MKNFVCAYVYIHVHVHVLGIVRNFSFKYIRKKNGVTGIFLKQLNGIFNYDILKSIYTNKRTILYIIFVKQIALINLKLWIFVERNS